MHAFITDKISVTCVFQTKLHKKLAFIFNTNSLLTNINVGTNVIVSLVSTVLSTATA